jgi:hypothetical protein
MVKETGAFNALLFLDVQSELADAGKDVPETGRE